MALPDRVGQDIAIIGMAALFPGAADLDSFWRNIVGGHDAITDVPADRWDPVFYDPSGNAPDRFYCRRGGFLGELATFDPTPFGMMPLAVDGVEPDQLIALRVARSALDDAGRETVLASPERTGVIVGRGGYLTSGVARLEQRVRTTQQLVDSVRSLVPGISGERLDEVRQSFLRHLGPDRPESAIDLVPNLVASRIANRLDLNGPAYTVDGACASSLLAVDAGMRELRSNRCDLVIAGGVHLCHDVTLWSVFTQLGALSPSQQIRPFDRRADGLLIGEGAGMVVLKRLEDADRDGDRVYAIISGLGVSSDGRAVSLMKPSVDGQLLALHRAWAESGLDPIACGLVEAHGTATPTGDAAELETLARFFGARSATGPGAGYPDGGVAVVGSVKSMIGHAMPAAGAASLIKAALAVHHGIAVPTLHCEEPGPLLDATRFRTSAASIPWDVDPVLRVAAVNAFGFGGINTHAVLRAHPDATGHRSPASKRGAGRWSGGHEVPVPSSIRMGAGHPRPGGRVLLLAAQDTSELLTRLDAVDLEERDDRLAVPGPDAGPLRLAIVDATTRRIELARRIVSGNRPWRGRNDVWFSPRGMVDDGGTVAFVFPGVEPNQNPIVDDVALHFGWNRPPRFGETELERQSRDVLWTGRILHAAMDRLGVRPDLVAGHSLGEWSGLIATGMVPAAIVDELSNGLLPNRLEVPDVTYLMVGADASKAAEVVEDLPLVDVSHDNCPHQSVLCGEPTECVEAARRLRAMGVLCQELDIRSGFHSPAFRPFLGPFRETYDRIEFTPPSVPLWSATAVAPYPSDPEAIRQLSIRHLVEPVRFRPLIEVLYRTGVRVFVQMGLGSVTGFVDDTLHDRAVATVSAGSARHAGMAQLVRAAAGLWVEGVPVDFGALAPSADQRPFGIPGAGSDAMPGPPAGQRLRLGVPLVRMEPGEVTVVPTIEAAPAGPWRPAAAGGLPDLLSTAPVDHPVVAAYQQLMADTVVAGRDVMEAWASARLSGAPGPAETASLPPEPDVTALSRTTQWAVSVETDPQLLDHCFYRQPAGWPSVADRFPVVPMTMLLEVMATAARELEPSLSVIGFDDVRALRWLAVAPPVEVTIRATRLDAAPVVRSVAGTVSTASTGAASTGGVGVHDDPDAVRVQVSIDGYSGATVVLATRYPTPPEPDRTPLAGARPSDLTAATMYVDRWMFHGPAYQGVTELGTIGDDGIRGVLADLPASGALLDCAGQLMGLWAMRATATDRLALPTSIRQVRFYGPRPGMGVPVPCTVWITEHSDRIVRSNMELMVGERVWARIDDWEDRRFDSDEVVWPVLIYPENNALADEWVVPGSDIRVQIVRERWSNSASRDLMMRRYLGEVERVEHDRHHPRGQRAHLLGRIAAKDAVRRWLWSRGAGPMHPVEVQVANDAAGRPVVIAPAGCAVRVSIGHTEWLAVAAVSDGVPIGVDIEPVVDRDPSFVDLALTAGEQRLRPQRWALDQWVARAWTAKESVAKARGTGLEGRPLSYEVESLETDRLTVRDPDGHRWSVATCHEDGYVLAVTVGGPSAPSVPAGSAEIGATGQGIAAGGR